MKLRRSFFAALLAALAVMLSGCGESIVYDQSGYTPGTCTDGVFTSPSGLSCTLNEDWFVYDAKSLEELTGLKHDLNDRQLVEDMLNSGQALYELYAVQSDRTILRVTAEDLRVRYGDISAQDYAEIQADHLPTMADTFSLTDVACQVVEVDINGERCPSVYMTSTMVHVKHYEQYVYLLRGNYLYTITCSSVENDRCAELLDLFRTA